jgi:hypothetical protein
VAQLAAANSYVSPFAPWNSSVHYNSHLLLI